MPWFPLRNAVKHHVHQYNYLLLLAVTAQTFFCSVSIGQPFSRQTTIILNGPVKERLHMALAGFGNHLQTKPFNVKRTPARGGMAERRPTDEELMLVYQGGSIEAFEGLFARYRTRLFNYFRRSLGDAMQAEDLSQTLFLRVHRARATYQPSAAFSTWIYTIARNLVRDALDKEREERARRVTTRTLQRETDEEPVPLEKCGVDEHPTPETTLQRKEIVARLQQALLSLSLEQREIILLSKYAELSFSEIAAILGCSVTAAKVRAFRALKALRAALGDMKDLC
jgi:RNA polymerase sigma-70 factor (ECF subfamily)